MPLVHLLQCTLRAPLPGIFISIVRALYNELDELKLLVGKNRDRGQCAGGPAHAHRPDTECGADKSELFSYCPW